jgi:4a-hydroxytetrahydrobiopterin dehydratase
MCRAQRCFCLNKVKGKNREPGSRKISVRKFIRDHKILIHIMTNLTQKKCQACEGGIPPLSKDQAEPYFKQISGWEADDNFKVIHKELEFENFKQALEFVNQVGELAESERHHPNIQIYSYNKVLIELTTHAIGGLSLNDFILAAKIDSLTA